MIYASSHVKFSRRLNYLQYEAAMRGHYEALLLGLGSEEKVTVLAHSAGAYFALRLLEAHPEKIERVVIMFPYIGYSTIGWLRFIDIPYIVDRVFPLAEIVAWCKNFLFGGDDQVRNISARELAANLRFGVRQCAYFNRHKLNVRVVAGSKDKITFLYTEPDRWCPAEAVEQLKTVSTHRKVLIPHDFIVFPEERAKMIQELGIAC